MAGRPPSPALPAPGAAPSPASLQGVPLFQGGGRFPFSGAFWGISLLHRSIFEPLPYTGLLARAARLCRPPVPRRPHPPPGSRCPLPSERCVPPRTRARPSLRAPCPRPGHCVPRWWHVAPWPQLHCGPRCPGPVPSRGRSCRKLTAVAGSGASRPRSPPTRCPCEGLALPLSPGPCW